MSAQHTPRPSWLEGGAEAVEMAIAHGLLPAAQQTSWPSYGDMTAEQMLAWGRAEQLQRLEDLKDRTPAGLRTAQANAEQRRKAIGAGRSVAATLCMDASRADRIARARTTFTAQQLIDSHRTGDHALSSEAAAVGSTS